MIEDLTNEEMLEEFESRNLIAYLSGSVIIQQFLDRSLMDELKQADFLEEVDRRNDVTMIHVPNFTDYAITAENQKPKFGRGAATIIVIE